MRSAILWVSLWLLIAAACLGDVQNAAASALQARTPPPVQAGFPLVLEHSWVYSSGLNAADLDGDGKKEIIFGNREVTSSGALGCHGEVYAVRPSGVIFWQAEVRADVDSTPVVVPDLNGDGRPDVVVGMGGFEAPGETAATECGKGNPDLPGNGGVVALDGMTGTVLWIFNTQDKGEWAVAHNGVLDGVWSSPAVGDILPDSPGPEIVVGAWDNCIYLLRKDGSPAWGVTPFDYSVHPALADQCNYHGFLAHDTVWSSPALADLDGDGRLDIIIGGDATAPNWYLMPNGGVLWAIAGDGSIMGQRSFDQTIYASPAIADLDGDGQLEIVVGTGDNWFDGDAHHSGRYITVLNYDRTQRDPQQRFQTKWELPTNGPMRSSPALGDLNLDGRPDIVAISKYDNDGGWWTVGKGETNGSYLYAWSGADGSLLPGFPIHICDSTGQAFPINTSPLIADIVGDEHPEIIYPHAREVGIMAWDSNTNTYGPYTRINDNQACWPGTTISAGQTALVYSRLSSQSGGFTATPLVDDLDGDGLVEIAAVGRWNEDGGSNQGDLWVWTGHKNGARPWPMVRQNSQHTGVYSLVPEVIAQPIDLLLHHVDGGAASTSGRFQLTNVGVIPLNWEVTSWPAIATVSPRAGTLQEQSEVYIDVSMDLFGYAPGVYDMGRIVVSSRASLAPVPVPVLTNITLTLVVRSSKAVFLPLILAPGTLSRAPTPVNWVRNSFQLGGGQVIDSSPTYADLNGDSRPEILIGTTSQQCSPATGGCTFSSPTFLAVFQADGALLWERDTQGSVVSAPAVGDIDGDGQPEVVITVGYDGEDQPRPGRVIAYKRDGIFLWEYRALDLDGNGSPEPVVASPTLCDLNRDGKLDIIFGGLDGHIRALDGAGKLLWDYDNAYAIRSTAACADLNNDGSNEVIIGATCTPDNPNFCGAGAGGRLFVFDREGHPLVRRGLPEAVWSSPVVGDLNRDGRPEIVVGTAWLWWKLKGVSPPYLYAFDTARVFDGSLNSDDPAKLPTLPGWPQPLQYPVSNSPILADLDRDGTLEVIAAASHPDSASDAIPGVGLIYAFRADGQVLPGWPVKPMLWQNQTTPLDGPIRGSPVAADIDGDGRLEVLVSALKSVYVYRSNGDLLTFPTSTTANVWAAPAVVDTDRDGRVEVWVGGTLDTDQAHGYLWRFTAFDRGFGALSWPMFRQNPQNTGHYR
jgi:hypothetical protein